jgi:hypothetical protein
MVHASLYRPSTYLTGWTARDGFLHKRVTWTVWFVVLVLDGVKTWQVQLSKFTRCTTLTGRSARRPQRSHWANSLSTSGAHWRQYVSANDRTRWSYRTFPKCSLQVCKQRTNKAEWFWRRGWCSLPNTTRRQGQGGARASCKHKEGYESGRECSKTETCPKCVLYSPTSIFINS